MGDTLDEGEIYWRNLHPWLKSVGYELRPRYRPGWIPSWVTRPPKSVFDEYDREDHLIRFEEDIMDVTRMRDGKQFVLKRIPKIPNNERDMALYLSTPPPSEDPRNNCIPVEDVLNPPGDAHSEIIVMRLLRPFDSPRFDTIGECVDFFLQAFKGLQFMHARHVAHRDCTGLNLMMDASDMYPKGFHPIEINRNPEYTGSAKYYTRTQRPPRYYWIDFGQAIRFDESDENPRAPCIHANDRSVPEFQEEGHELREYDPFPIDIYYLGNMVREYFLEGHEHYPKTLGLEFMRSLVEDMVQDDPTKRPNIDECVYRLEEIVRSLSSWKLRSQVELSDDTGLGYIARFFPHWIRRISYIIRRIPPIPIRKKNEF